MKTLLAVLVLFVLMTPLPAGAEAIGPTLGAHYLTGAMNIAGTTPASTTYLAYSADLVTGYYLGDNWTPTGGGISDLPMVANGIPNPPFVVSGTGPSAAWLVNQHAASIASSGDAAALQLAVWLTLYRNLPLNAFSFGAQTEYVRTTAANWSQGAAGMVGDDIWLDFQGGPGLAHGQDLVPANSVPEPASMLLFGVGLIGR